MNPVRLFFTHWGIAFLAVGFAFSGMWYLCRFATDGSFPFTHPKWFKELAPYSKDEKERLLQKASKEAFQSWKSVLPVFAQALLISGGLAVGWTVPKVTSLPDVWYMQALYMSLIALPFSRLTTRLVVNRVRPFLMNVIEKTSPAAPNIPVAGSTTSLK